MENEYPEINEFIKGLMKSGEIDEIRIDEEGIWTHKGQEFTNRRIIDFFTRSIDVTAEGDYVIHYGDSIYPVTVDDVPLFITGARFDGFGSFEKVFITISTGEEEELDPETLYYRENNCLYCYVRKGRIPAKFSRSPSFQILERLEETDDIFFVDICGKRIVLREKVD
jgi:hypothetical protein